jgi:GrpB-like predicted nucleotidyltransferase (UPF0157 family)
MPTFAETVAAGGRQVGRTRSEPVVIVDYNPLWPQLFAWISTRLAQALGDQAVRIEHIGSTSVRGLAAKSVVDIQISVPDAEDEAAYLGAIEAEGFEMRWIETGHRYLRPPPELPRLWQVHVCSAGGQWERVHILFRDYLRSHPDAAADYAAIKREMAEKHRSDSIAYNDAKGPFIEGVVARAEKWASETGWRVVG